MSANGDVNFLSFLGLKKQDKIDEEPFEGFPSTQFDDDSEEADFEGFESQSDVSQCKIPSKKYYNQIQKKSSSQSVLKKTSASQELHRNSFSSHQAQKKASSQHILKKNSHGQQSDEKILPNHPYATRRNQSFFGLKTRRRLTLRQELLPNKLKINSLHNRSSNNKKKIQDMQKSSEEQEEFEGFSSSNVNTSSKPLEDSFRDERTSDSGASDDSCSSPVFRSTRLKKHEMFSKKQNILPPKDINEQNKHLCDLLNAVLFIGSKITDTMESRLQANVKDNVNVFEILCQNLIGQNSKSTLKSNNLKMLSKTHKESYLSVLFKNFIEMHHRNMILYEQMLTVMEKKVLD